MSQSSDTLSDLDSASSLDLSIQPTSDPIPPQQDSSAAPPLTKAPPTLTSSNSAPASIHASVRQPPPRGLNVLGRAGPGGLRAPGSQSSTPIPPSLQAKMAAVRLEIVLLALSDLNPVL